MIDKLLTYISIFLALLIVLPVHEFAHAFVAVKSGDMTPKLYKRYTLNPLAHFDIFGLIAFVLVKIGWAKPVPINPNNFKHRRLDSVLVSIAGVTANYLLAFLVFPLYFLAFFYLPEFGYFTRVIVDTLGFIVSLSLSFFVFNLLPIYPLDGFRLIEALSKRENKVLTFLRKYGSYILLAFILLGFIADITGLYYLDVLGTGLGYVRNLILQPISMFWGLFF